MSFIRSISGLRATLGDDLLPEPVGNYTAAFSEISTPGKIVIGRDGRPSGKWIEQIVCGTLIACGREVVSLGTVPTPTVQLMVEELKAAGGIVITASHNPELWNGLKFLNYKGIFLDKDENEKLWECVNKKQFKFLSNFIFPEIGIFPDAIEHHISKILSSPIFAGTDKLEKIRKRKFKVVIDAVNSSGSVAISSLLASLGSIAIPLFCDGTGIFPHTPEPLPQNLTILAEAVKINNADLGIAVDPDADRLVLIDETGSPIGEEKTISLAVLAVLSNKELFSENDDYSVVVNLSTTRLVEDIAAKFGTKVFRSPVGEINVVKKMKEVRAIIGGEGSGGVILPACHYGRDSLVGTSLLLSFLADKNLTLGKLSNSLPKYEMLKFKQEFSGSLEPLIPIIKSKFPNANINEEDGIRIDLEKSWVQLRKSNTEPIIRIISEAETAEEAEELAEKIKSMFDF